MTALINFLIYLTMIFLNLFALVMFACAFLLGIALLDYMLDIDIKEKLNKELGPRPRWKALRRNIEKIFRKADELSDENL